MNTIEALYLLKYNPFKYASYIYSFYDSLGKFDKNLLLSPLIIPLCSHPVYSQKIKNLKPSKSTLYTLFKNRQDLYDIQERISCLRYLTIESTQLCIANDWVELDTETLSLCTNRSDIKLESIPEKLGGFLRNYSIEEIYFHLGVKL